MKTAAENDRIRPRDVLSGVLRAGRTAKNIAVVAAHVAADAARTRAAERRERKARTAPPCPGEPRVYTRSDFRSMDERRDT